MKHLLAAALFAAPAALAAAPAHADGHSATFVLDIFAKGRWSAECALETERGSSTPRAAGRGSSSTGTLVGRYATGGTCTIEASRRGPVELTLRDEDGAFACPFEGVAEGETCRGVVPAGETFEFAVARAATAQGTGAGLSPE